MAAAGPATLLIGGPGQGQILGGQADRRVDGALGIGPAAGDRPPQHLAQRPGRRLGREPGGTQRAAGQRDPADRIIVATARALDVPLLTRDKQIRSSGLVQLWKGK